MKFTGTIRSWKSALTVLLVLFLVGAIVGLCLRDANETPTAGKPVVMAFCAAGTTDVITRLAEDYETWTGVEVKLNLASSSTLARQIEAGAKADIFISANPQWMDYMAERGLIAPESRTDWARNRLVLVVPKKSAIATWVKAGLEDATDDGPLQKLAAVEGRIAVGDPSHVPAGIYAKQAMESAGLYETLKDRLVACASVRAALRLVEDGQVAAGIVYQSDAAVSDRVTMVGVLPERWHNPITFQIARVAGSSPEAVSLLAFLRNEHAIAMLPQFGFERTGEASAAIAMAEGPSPSIWRFTEAERQALLISLRVACLSVALLVVPGTLLGYGLARKNFAGKSLVEALVHAPLVLPPVVTGYLLLLVLGNNGFIGRWLHEQFGIETAFTLTAAAIASAVVAMPLMVRAVRLAMTVADRKLEQASYTLGAGPVKTFLLISLPLAAPGIVAGMVLAFARSLGEFGATAVFMGNMEGQRTIPLAIYASLQMAHGEQSAWRLVAISVVISILAVTMSEILARRAGRYLEQDHAS